LNIVELGVPFLVQSFKNKDNNNHEFSTLKIDMNKDQLESLIDDYLEILLQLTMVLTFGVAFPLTLTLFWILSVLELRVDLFKYVHFNKRGLCSSKPGIGIWY